MTERSEGREVEPTKAQSQPKSISVRLTAPDDRLTDALRVIGSFADMHYESGVAPPSKGAITRARRVALAVGPLADGPGPRKLVLAPSAKGGVVMKFITNKGDVSIACMNDPKASTLLVIGKAWTGKVQVHECSLEQAVERTRLLLDDLTQP